MKGPGLVCGQAFAIVLRENESLSWKNPAEDFIVYRLVRPDGTSVIYEGNAPQPGGVVTRTGLSWPAKVVVHDKSEIAKRLRFGKSILSKCPAAGGSKK